MNGLVSDIWRFINACNNNKTNKNVDATISGKLTVPYYPGFPYMFILIIVLVKRHGLFV